MFTPFSFYGGLPDPNIIFFNDNIITSQAVLESKLTGETIKYFIIDGNEKTSFSKTNYTINTNAFKGVSSGTKNPITYVKMEKATSIGNSAFQYCSLTEADFPDLITIGSSCFQNSVGIETGYFPKMTTIGVCGFCSNSLKPYIQIRQDVSGSGILYIPSYVNTGNATSGLSNQSAFSGNSLTGSFSNVSSSATHYLPNLTNVFGNYTFNNTPWSSLELVGLTKINGFGQCVGFNTISQTDNTADVYIPNVLELGFHSFPQCGLTKVDLETATTIRGLFGNTILTSISQTDSLASVYIPSATKLGYQAFKDCIGIVSADLPYITTINEGEALRNTKITSVSTTSSFTADCQLNGLLADGLNGASGGSNTGFGSFSNITTLTKVYAPRITTTPNGTFGGLTNVAITTISQTDPSASIYIPDAVNTANISYQGAFSACNKLVSADLPFLTQIGTFYFNGCTLLNYVNLPGITKGYLGTSPTTNNSFTNTALNGTINVPITLATNNAGGPDADLVYLAGRGWIINYL